MATTLCLSKPVHLFTPQTHKPTNLNPHPNNVSIHISHSSYPGGSSRMRIGDYSLMPTGAMRLGGAGTGILALKEPMASGRMIWKRRRVPAWRSLTLESLRGGTASLEALLDAKRARLDPRLLDNAETKFQSLLSHPRIEPHDLKRVARELEMSRKEDEAVKMLTEALERFEAEDKGSHENYETKLLLIEMLIYQGDYKRAKKISLQVQQDYKAAKEETIPSDPFPGPTSLHVEHVGPTDYKLQLYQAVISFLLGETKEAKEHWDEFNLLTGRGFGGGGPPKMTMDLEDPFEEYHHGLTFDEFQDHITVLKQEIQAARKGRRT